MYRIVPLTVLEDIFFIAEELFLPSLTPVEFVKNTAGFYPQFDEDSFYQYLKLLEVDQYRKYEQAVLWAAKKSHDRIRARDQYKPDDHG